jgi:hypothetical protein
MFGIKPVTIPVTFSVPFTVKFTSGVVNWVTVACKYTWKVMGTPAMFTGGWNMNSAVVLVTLVTVGAAGANGIKMLQAVLAYSTKSPSITISGHATDPVVTGSPNNVNVVVFVPASVMRTVYAPGLVINAWFVRPTGSGTQLDMLFHRNVPVEAGGVNNVCTLHGKSKGFGGRGEAEGEGVGLGVVDGSTIAHGYSDVITSSPFIPMTISGQTVSISLPEPG